MVDRDEGRTTLGPAVLDEDRLVAWGERVGAVVDAPAVFALRGELGAGKSVLARAMARGAGVSGPMPSPTFNLVYRYRGDRGLDVVHLDLYRLERPDEVWELGWRELGAGPELVLIEWPERAEELLPADRWDVWLEYPRAGVGAGSGENGKRTDGDADVDGDADRGRAEVGGEVGDAGLRVVRAVARGAAPELPELE